VEIHPADVDLLHLLVVYRLVRDFTTAASDSGIRIAAVVV